MKSKNAIWAILVVGLLSLIAFGSMGLWNQSHPIFKIRDSVTQKFGIEVERMDLVKNDEGRTFAVNFILKNEKPIEEKRGKEMALELFVDFMSLKPDNQLEKVRLTTAEGVTFEAPRIFAIAVGSASRRLDKMKLALMVLGLGQAELKVPSAGNYGANIRVDVLVNARQFKDPKLMETIASTIQKTRGVTIGSVEVILRHGKNDKKSVVIPPKGRKIGRSPSYK